MRLEQLQYFADVAKTGSINFTAQNLYATQQSINTSLKRLEEEVGYPLLHRSTAGVSLTPYGRLFLGYAVDTLDNYDQVLQQMSTTLDNNESINEGSFSIITASVLCDVAFPDILNTFHNTFPKVKLKITKIDNESLIQQFEEGTYDLGFLTASEEYIENLLTIWKPLCLESHLLLNDRLVACLKANSFYSEKKELTHEEFSQNQFSIYGTIPSALFREQVYVNALHVSDDAAFHKKLMLNNLCITLMPEFAYHHLFKSKKFLSISINNTSPIQHVMIKRRDTKNELTDCFTKMVLQTIQKFY